MSTISAHPPIHRLNTDLLLYIIKMNADMFSDNTALETTLTTSRVCHVWRDLMLNLPFLWARLIDLDRLHGRQDTLENELLRRSGTALLWIKARRCGLHGANSRAGCTEYALDFLGANWGEIQKFEVSINTQYVDPAQWAPLCVPAPYLESITISLNNSAFDVKPPFHLLFGHSAPMLHEFRSNRFSATLAMPWLCQLSSIELSGRLTVTEALELLNLAQNLVSFRFYDLVTEVSALSLPFVVLPRLAHLLLHSSGERDTCAVLLDHIQVPATCKLECIVHELPSEEIVNQPALWHIVRTISKFSRRYFTHYTPTKLLLKYSPTYFALMDHTVPNYSEFRFSLGFAHGNSFSTDAFSLLLREFAILDFSNITELTFKLHNTSAVDLTVSESIALFARLPAIRTLDLDPSALCHVIRVQEAIETVGIRHAVSFPFPTLKVLKIHPFPASSSPASTNPISKFILKRISLGLPINVLDISQSTLEVLPAMSLFKEVDGLKVVWRHMWASENVEYICRSGSPRNIPSINE